MEKVNLNFANAVNFKANENTQTTPPVQTQQPEAVKNFDAKMEKPLSEDKAEISATNPDNDKIAQRQKALKEARSKAAGWSCLFGIFDTLYYGLRSDKTVADKFDLDEDKDKEFIKQVKKEQVLWTLPSVAVGIAAAAIKNPVAASVASLGVRLGAYVYNKTLDSSKLQVTDK